MAFDAGKVETKFTADTSGHDAGLQKVKSSTESTASSVTKGFIKAQVAMELFKRGIGLVTGAARSMSDILVKGAGLDRLRTVNQVLYKNLNDKTLPSLRNMREALADANTFGSNAESAIKSLLAGGLVPLAQQVERVNQKTGETDKGFGAFILTIKDLAASAGISSGQGIDLVTRSLNQMNPTMLESMGVQINLASLWKANQSTLKDLTGEQLIAAQRQLFFNEIMKEGSKVAGVYDATYKTAGKNLLSIQDAMESTKETLGLALQPAFQFVTAEILNFIKAIRVFVEDNEPKIRGFAESLKDTMIAAKEAVKGFVDEFANSRFKKALDELISFIRDNAQPLLAGFAIFLATVLVPILATAVGSFAALVASLVTAAAPIVVLIAAVALLYKAFQTNFLGIGDVVRRVVDWFKNVGLPAAKSFFDGLRNKLQEVAKSPAVQQFISIIRDSIGNAITNLRDGFEQFKPKIDELVAKFQEFWVKIEPLRMVLQKIGEVFLIIVAVITGVLIIALFKLIEVIAAAVFPVLGFLVDLVMGIMDAFGWLVQFIANTIVPSFILAMQKIGTIVNWLKNNIINPAIANISAAFNFWMNNVIKPVVNRFVANIKIIASVMKWIWGNIISPILLLINAIFLRVFYEIFKVVSSVVSRMLSLISSRFSLIKSIIVAAVNVAKSVVSAGFNFIRDRLVSPIRDAYNQIKPILDQIKSAISNGLNAVKNSISSIAGSIKNALVQPFKDALGEIENVAASIKDAAAQISPFHKSSPSLVEYVEMGMDKIANSYNILDDLAIEPVSQFGSRFEARQAEEFASTAGQIDRGGTPTRPAKEVSDIIVKVDNYYGDKLGLRGLAEKIIQEAGALQAAGRPINIKLQ